MSMTYHASLTVAGIQFTVDYDYTPPEVGGWDSPPVQESRDVLAVRLQGSDVDLFEVLAPDVLAQIEAALAGRAYDPSAFARECMGLPREDKP